MIQNWLVTASDGKALSTFAKKKSLRKLNFYFFPIRVSGGAKGSYFPTIFDI